MSDSGVASALVPMSQQLSMIFASLLILVMVLEFVVRQGRRAHNKSPEYQRLRNHYLGGYLAYKAADWTMGPYFYKVYQSKGLPHHVIAGIFLCGFFSGMVFGTFVGSLADRLGRKRGTQLCALLFSCSCLSTHSDQLPILMLGRFLGGAATSLLYSSFESWMVCEHKALNLPEESRSSLFGLVMLGDGIVAMLAGFLALGAREVAGYSGPFDCSVILLAGGALFIGTNWRENYGNSKVKGLSNFTDAVAVLRQSPGIALLGCVTSLFESSMYTFVFLWTAALQAAADKEGRGEMPLGLVFSCFMAAIMCGSRVFAILTQRLKLKPRYFAVPLLAIASVCLCVCGSGPPTHVLLAALLGFEFCCGVYFPSFGTIRATVVPEKVRATILNLFRVPLNAFVAMSLLLSSSGSGSNTSIFYASASAVALACLIQFQLCGRLPDAAVAAEPTASPSTAVRVPPKRRAVASK